MCNAKHQSSCVSGKYFWEMRGVRGNLKVVLHGEVPKLTFVL